MISIFTIYHEGTNTLFIDEGRIDYFSQGETFTESERLDVIKGNLENAKRKQFARNINSLPFSLKASATASPTKVLTEVPTKIPTEAVPTDVEEIHNQDATERMITDSPAPESKQIENVWDCIYIRSCQE